MSCTTRSASISSFERWFRRDFSRRWRRATSDRVLGMSRNRPFLAKNLHSSTGETRLSPRELLRGDGRRLRILQHGGAVWALSLFFSIRRPRCASSLVSELDSSSCWSNPLDFFSASCSVGVNTTPSIILAAHDSSKRREHSLFPSPKLKRLIKLINCESLSVCVCVTPPIAQIEAPDARWGAGKRSRRATPPACSDERAYPAPTA